MEKPKIPEKFEESSYNEGWAKTYYGSSDFDVVEFVCFDEDYAYFKARDNHWSEHEWWLFRNKIKSVCSECGRELP